MDNWIELISFTLPQDAYLVKGRLESEGIETFLKDELTTQVYNFYSNAIGGVKLLVREPDYQRAYDILVESKYIVSEEKKPNKTLQKLDKFTSGIPVIRKWRLELRLITLITLFLLLVILPFAPLSIPTKSEILIYNHWCVESIVYKGSELQPNTFGIHFITSENINCPEEVEFYKDSSVVFPGINTFSVNNKWILKNDSIFISRDVTSADTAQISGVDSGLFYTGAYKLDLKGKHLKMQSSDITIICRRN